MAGKLTVLRLIALVGLGVSMVLLVDHLRSTPFFCGFESGCDEVVQSAFGKLGGVPLPWFGVAGFGAFFVASLFPASLGGLLMPMALLAGLAGLGLLYIQAQILDQFCPLCLIADASAMALALVTLAGPQTSPAAAPRPWGFLWAGLSVLVLAGPWAAHWFYPPPPVPEQVEALWVADKIN